MNVFKVNWDRFILLLLPAFLRKPLIFAFLRAALFPLKQVYGQFTRLRENNLFLMKYDTSRRNLEIALRAKFNSEGIYIENAVYDKGLYTPFYASNYIRRPGYHTEIKKAYLPQYAKFYLGEPMVKDDFTIYIPEAAFIVHEENSGQITDFARLFVLPGFKFSVVRY